MWKLLEFLGPRSVLGECPLWDRRNGALFWVDIDGCAVHRLDWVTGDCDSRPTSGRPGSIALTEAGGVLLVGMERGLYLLDFDSGDMQLWRDLPITEPSVRLNDGRVDRSGALWIGSMHVPASDNRFLGALYRVTPDGEVARARGDVGVANGLAFSGDGQYSYFADSLCGTVWRWDSAENPVWAAVRPFIDFEQLNLPGRPDGACVDAEGGYWIACVHGAAVVRISPTGEVDRVIQLPVRRPTCPSFGGPDLETLFVTTIGGGNRHYESWADEPEAGRILALDVGCRGVEEPRFAAESQANPPPKAG